MAESEIALVGRLQEECFFAFYDNPRTTDTTALADLDHDSLGWFMNLPFHVWIKNSPCEGLFQASIDRAYRPTFEEMLILGGNVIPPQLRERFLGPVEEEEAIPFSRWPIRWPEDYNFN